MSDRIFLIRLNVKPINVTIIKMYITTTEHEKTEVEDTYGTEDELLKKNWWKKLYTYNGDFNAVVREGSEWKTIGKYELGKRYQRGER